MKVQFTATTGLADGKRYVILDMPQAPVVGDWICFDGDQTDGSHLVVDRSWNVSPKPGDPDVFIYVKVVR